MAKSPGKAAARLNDAQRIAAEHVHGPILVVAGAGTGKTSVLVERIANLIENGHAKANEILALTYTVKASEELRVRVGERVGPAAKGLTTGTFHNYCFDLLKRHGLGFDVVDDKDLWVMLRRRIDELPLRRFIKAASMGEFLNDLQTFFNRCDDELVTAADYREYVERLKRDELPLPRVGRPKKDEVMPREEVIARCEEIAGVFAKVEEMLAAQGLGTFGKMITGAVDLLRKNEAALKDEQSRARFTLLDEFQDSNHAQIQLAKLLAGTERNVFAVGDPDQAIYRFRGASHAAFDLFLREFPDAKKLTLGENYRSTSKVLTAAFAAIRSNPEIASGTEYQRRPLVPGRESQSALFEDPVTVLIADDNKTEAEEIADRIQRLHEQKVPFDHIAVLYRIHSHRDLLIESLAAREIPFSVTGVNILDASDIRDLIAAMRVMNDPADSISLLRMAAQPRYGIDGAEVREVLRANDKNAPLLRLLEKIRNGPELGKDIALLRERLKASEYKGAAAAELAARWLQRESQAVRTFVEFVQNWAKKKLTASGELPEFLEYLEFFVEAGGMVELPTVDKDAVQLMTAHVAKGLEFDHVFVMRVSPGSFPSQYRPPLFEFPNELRKSAFALDESSEIHQQEERRLFYVALTRARDSLTLTCKKGRGKNPIPSGYVRSFVESRDLREVIVSKQIAARPAFVGSAVAVESVIEPWMNLPLPAHTGGISLSPTSIQTFELCPMQFKLQREWHLPDEPGPQLLFGATVHDLLKIYYEQMQKGKTLSREELITMLETAMAGIDFEEERQRELFIEQGRRQLTGFLSANPPDAMPKVLLLEKSFQLAIGAVNIRGRIDRVDELPTGGVLVTDYKTGRPKTQENADDSLQLSVYAIACERELGLKPERLAFYNLETNQAVETRRSAADLEATAQKIKEVADKIEREEYDATPGRHCRWCAYQALCPATEERLYTIAPMAKAFAQPKSKALGVN